MFSSFYRRPTEMVMDAIIVCHDIDEQCSIKIGVAQQGTKYGRFGFQHQAKRRKTSKRTQKLLLLLHHYYFRAPYKHKSYSEGGDKTKNHSMITSLNCGTLPGRR